MMEEKTPNNFNEGIHRRDYRKAYEIPAGESIIADRFRSRESLDGQWNFSPDVYDAARRQNWFLGRQKNAHGQYIPWDFDYDYWDLMPVPSVWNTGNPTYLYYEGCGVYTRTFSWVKKADERVLLKVGAAYHEATVFLNGKQAGYHKGGDTPFYMDVTDNLLEENRVFISVDNKRSFDRIPSYCTDWYNYGGLYRSLELFRVPRLFIKTFQVGLVPDGQFDKIFLNAELSEPTDTEGILEIPELDFSCPVKFHDGRAKIQRECRPGLWTPQSPQLYDVFLKAGKDSLKERIGFREIRTEGTKILLNGEPLKLKGISCHEESVTNGKAISDDEIRENFALAKELGCNFMRLAHYPHTERAAQIADESGILLWEEVPVYWSIEFENPAVLENARQQLTELIKRDFNRASVIIWSVGNENPDTDDRLTFMADLAGLCRDLDNTRMVSAACLVDEVNNRIEDRLAEHLDIIGMNEYYGWYDPWFPRLEEFFENSNPDKPVIITETGGGAKAGHHGSISDMFTEEHQEALYKEQVRCIEKVPYIAGLSPWILYDFRTPVRTNRFQKGYNRKGLLSEDKRYRKKAFYILQDFYSRWRV